MYAAIVHSIALYGAPIWAQEMQMDGAIKAMVHRAQRTMAIRASRCYRTVSFRAATVLSGIPPLEYVAAAYRQAYLRVKMLRRRSGPQNVTKREVALIRLQCRENMMAVWSRELEENNGAGRRVVEAVKPHLAEWMENRKGAVTFHMAQVLTGHGCFGEYLRRIGKELTAACYHCNGGDGRIDTADHTLAVCDEWKEERQQLKDVIGNGLSLSAVIGAITTDDNAWKAFATFCGKIMRRKEEAERIRRGEQPPPLPPTTQRRRRPRSCRRETEEEEEAVQSSNSDGMSVSDTRLPSGLVRNRQAD